MVRGNHFHTRKIERFSVIKGKAKIQLREILSDNKCEFIIDGDKPSYVDIPIWYTHNIENIGDEELITIFWINEHYNEDRSDTYLENVNFNRDYEYKKIHLVTVVGTRPEIITFIKYN